MTILNRLGRDMKVSVEVKGRKKKSPALADMAV
jgi:hypothetical protein